MESPKKRKGDSDDPGSFASFQSAEDFRAQLTQPDPLPYIKDYFSKDESNVTNYIKAGGSVAELAGVLAKYDLKRREQSAVIFNALHLVIIKLFTESSDQNQFRDDCKQFVANYTGELKSILTSNTIIKNKKIALKLLASLSVISTSLASQILSMLSFSKEDLDFLTAHSDPLDEQNLRVSFIHFLLSFIIDQATKVIERLLMKTTWLPSIFPGLRYDLPFTVHLVLSTLEEKIVNNVNISKTLKLQAFNANSLFHLSQLYTWNMKAWFDANPHKTYTGDFSDNEIASIRVNVHKILLKICTSSKLGIVFQDTLYGSSDTQKNYTLSNFLKKLEQPFNDESKKELLFKILVTCPDLIKPILRAVVLPVLSTPKGLDVLEFVTEVLKSIQLNLEDLSETTRLSIVHNVIVPNPIIMAIKNSNYLTSENTLQKLSSIKFIKNALNNYWRIFSSTMNDENDPYGFRGTVSAYFINSLPNCIELLECLKSSYINREEELVTELINLVIIYEKLCPELVDLIRYDDTITKWLGEETSNVVNEKDHLLIMNLIRLEIIINPLDPYQNEFLNRLKWTTISKANKDIGLDIMKELLLRTGLFIRSPKELNLWIYCIEKNYHSDIGHLISSSIKWALENTSYIYKNLLKAQQQSTDENVSDLNLDDFIKLSMNDDVPGLEENTASSILLLSPLLPSILQVLSEKESHDVNDDFLVAFIVHYLHQQITVKPYITLLEKYTCPSMDKVMPFVMSWLDHPKSLDFIPFKTTLFSAASHFILKGKDSYLSDILERPLQKIEAELLLEECCFMACELSRLNKATPQRLERTVEIVKYCFKQSGLEIKLNHPTLLSNFHPLCNVGDSDLTHLVTVIAEHGNLSKELLAPFSHRLAFELKYAKKIVYNYEDNMKLLKLLKIFHFSQSDTEDLITYVFPMKSKYFERNSNLSPWGLIIIHLLTLAKEYKIIFPESNLIDLLNSLITLSKKCFDTSEVYSALFSYLTSVYSDINGAVMDSFKELFHALCSTTHWHEELCVFLFLHLDDIDYSQIPVERAITLLASLEAYNAKHCEVVADSAGVIYQGFCERPSPKWLADLKKIQAALPVETCKKICKRVKKHSKEIYCSVEALSALEIVFYKAEEMYTLYTLVLHWLYEAMNLTSTTSEQLEREEMCKILQRVLSSDIDKTAIEKANNDIIMNLLLQGLKVPSAPMLDVIHSFVKYNVNKLPPGEIFELLCSHSAFLDVLLGKSSAKCSTVNLMLELLSQDNSLISANHVPVLLSSYNASLSKVDQQILKVLQIYEKIGCINLACWKPYVWGEAAVDHYSVRSKIAPLKPNPDITLELFEKSIVQRTITKYPLNRGLDGDCDLDDGEIYDPAFYLPLLSQLVSETTGSWKIVGSGAIGLSIAALASSEPLTRAAAYHVLHRFYSSLNDHKDNLIWKHFIGAIRGGIVDLKESDNVRLSSIVTTFLARASGIMSSPDDPLYFTLHNFIYAKPHLKLNTVPAFFEMFHSHGNQKIHQRWMLEVLKDGIREQRDLQIALNCLTFKFLLDYHSCALASPKIKELIEAVVAKCVQFVDEKQLLINNYSIISWFVSANSKLLKELPKNISPQYIPLIQVYQKQLAM